MSRMDQDAAERHQYTGDSTDRVLGELRGGLRAGLFALILATGLAGCTQGEEVFLRQNQASAALAYTIMDIEDTRPE